MRPGVKRDTRGVTRFRYRDRARQRVAGLRPLDGTRRRELKTAHYVDSEKGPAPPRNGLEDRRMSSEAIAIIIAACMSSGVAVWVAKPRPHQFMIPPTMIQPPPQLVSSGAEPAPPSGEAASVPTEPAPVPPQPSPAQASVQTAPAKTSAAFTIGLIGLVAWFLPIVGVPLAIFGLGLAVRHLREPAIYKKTVPALWLNVAALSAGIANAALGVALYG